MSDERPTRPADGPGFREAVRAVHRTYPTGVAVVTTIDESVPYGLLCNAFASVSLDPPLVLVCVNTAAQTHEHLHRRDHLGINFLASDQVTLARQFATAGGDKFSGIAWHPGGRGVPVLEGTASHLEAEIESRTPAGSHTVFICRVLEAVVHDRPPLLYLAGDFHSGAELGPPLD